MAMKINRLEIENVKRIKAVTIEPTESGLTIIGGKNAQGKTSVLDAIAWALGGEKHRPSMAVREGSVIPPALKIVMNNGLVVERKGKNSDLKVTDPEGKKGGQQLLNEFVEELALNLPKFMNASGKEKAETLLRIIGVGDQLAELERQEKECYQERTYVGRTADQKRKYADEQTYYPDVPDEPVSASELIREQQEILARNGENHRKRALADELRADYDRQISTVKALEDRLAEAKERLARITDDLETANKNAMDLEDESTEELERSIANVEEINRKIRANLDKEKAEEDARAHIRQYETLTAKLTEIRQAKTDLLHGAELPLPGLSVEDGELIYNGQKWDNMSASEQLIVATSIIRKLKPECGFVLLDKLEQMDLDTLHKFGVWLGSIGLQAIATRVSTGEECSVIIEDGYVASEKDEKKKVTDWSKVEI